MKASPGGKPSGPHTELDELRESLERPTKRVVNGLVGAAKSLRRLGRPPRIPLFSYATTLALQPGSVHVDDDLLTEAVVRAQRRLGVFSAPTSWRGDGVLGPPLPPVDEGRERALGGSPISPPNRIYVTICGIRCETIMKPDYSRAVGYCRMSTDDQRMSVDVQRAGIKRWAQETGVELCGVFVDEGVSGSAEIGTREGLSQALAFMRVNRVGNLVVLRRDRLARGIYVAATIEQAFVRLGAKVVCADGNGNGETPADVFMRSILDAAAAYEKDLIKQRTRDALAALKKSGRRYSRSIPYGYEAVPDPDRPGKKVLQLSLHELGIVFRMRELNQAGHGCYTVANMLAIEGKLNRDGKPFTSNEVWRILKKPNKPA